MKKYRQELSSFFNVKRAEDEKFKRTILKKSFKEKQEYIKSYRNESALEDGTFRVDAAHQFERQRFVRDIHYFNNLNEQLKEKYDIFTRYKYDVLYELIDMDEAQYDSYETEINELKARRDDYISKQAVKQDEHNSMLESLRVQIKERMDEFKDASKDEKIELYTQIIDLRKQIFDTIEPKLSILDEDGVKTIVVNYLPIKGNERNVKNLNVTINSAELNVESLDDTNEISESQIEAEAESESESDSEGQEKLSIGNEVSINSESLE